MFQQLETVNSKPKVFEFYTARELWADPHTSSHMLSFHLDPDVDISSRNMAFINASVKWIASKFKIGKSTCVADFGCGPGLYTTQLAKYQAHITGIDFSHRSIEFAQKTAQKNHLAIDYETINYLDYETDKRFHLILMIFCDFCALSPFQRKTLLSKFYDFLVPGGAVLLDVFSFTAFDKLKEEALYEANLLDGFWSSSKYYGFLNRFRYEKEKVALEKYTIIEPQGARTIYNWLQYFSPKILEKEFTQVGFTIEAVYGDVAGAAFHPKNDEFAVIARKQK